ncbi:sodium-dependent glucose transporter 1-like [Mercenaria mercenaria]|uniref:sodium-dependent glucose transporter 1-like n=1 Tax=Mercenaria mercenaria TaxID=6596 RepID=UPI00234EB393|nr:sodium-dependent glucose transporter 1-like [Mercenaria mercenaria]
MTILGWEYGQMGPVFPDLRDIAGVSLKQGSWLFTGFAVGYLAGCLIAGFTQTRFSSNLLLFFYTIVSAGAYTVTPWIPVFEVMVFLLALSGLGIGGQDTCVHTMLFETWDSKVGPYFQMLHVLYAVGGIISPLATKPFLRKNIQEGHPDIVNSTQAISIQNATQSSVSIVSTNRSNSLDDVIMTDTDVHYALLVSGLLSVSAAVPFLAIFFKDQRAKKSQHQNNAVKVITADKQTRLPSRIERIVLCIFLLNSFVATAFLDLFPSFLTTFVIKQAGMTQQVGSNLTSAYFAMYAVGNFLNIFASVYIKITKIIIFSYISTVAMLTGVLLSVVFPNEVLLSVFVSLSGLSSATIIATIYTWIQEHVTPVTGKLASGLLISGSLGISLNPLLTGYLMDVYSPLWFIYLSLGNTLFCAVLFITAMLLTKTYSNDMNVTEETIRANQTTADEIKDGNTDIHVNGKLQNVYEITHF